MRGIKIPQQDFQLKMPGGGGAYARGRAYLRDTTVFRSMAAFVHSFITLVPRPEWKRRRRKGLVSELQPITRPSINRFCRSCDDFFHKCSECQQPETAKLPQRHK